MKNKGDVSIGERIMLLRNDLGYSRDYVAEAADISSKFLYEIEVNKKGFSAGTLFRLADVLEVSMEYIMTGEGNRKCDEQLTARLGRFKPNTLDAVQELLQIASEILRERDYR